MLLYWGIYRRSEEKHALFVVEVSRITGVERQASSPTLFGLTLTFAEGLPPAHLSFADEPTRSMWLRLIEARRHWLVSLTRNMGASGPSQLSSGDGSQSTFARMHQVFSHTLSLLCFCVCVVFLCE